MAPGTGTRVRNWTAVRKASLGDMAIGNAVVVEAWSGTDISDLFLGLVIRQVFFEELAM